MVPAETPKLVLLSPAGMVVDAGTFRLPEAESAMTAPPATAGLLKVRVQVPLSPDANPGGAQLSETSAGGAIRLRELLF